MIGKEEVEQEEDPEGDIQVAPHQIVHARAEHLHDHLASLIRGPVHLAE
jgi:hypothetical protein